MFGSIRRHQQWLWIVIATIVILSFLVFFSPDSQFTPVKTEKVDLGSFNNRPIEREEYLAALKEAKLNHFMRSGGREWPGSDENARRGLERDAISRLFIIDRVKEMQIAVSDTAVARAARERLGDFPPEKFESEYLKQQNLTLADFERYMRHEAQIQQLVGVAAASAKLLTPREAEILFRKEHEQAATQVVGFWVTNYLDKIQPTPEDISKFYSNGLAMYRVPERIQASYVEFNPTNFFAEVDAEFAKLTNFNALIDEAYIKGGGKERFKGTNGVPLTEKEAKEKIREEERLRTGYVMARRKAADFGNKLIDQKQQTISTFEKLAAAEGYPVKVTPPFSATQGLEDTNFPSAFREKALQLRKESPILYSPVPGENAIYVLALKTNLLSELPPLEAIREKVTADYKRSQALEMARKEGTTFHTNLTNGLTLKKTFAEICDQAKVKPVVVTPFSASTNALPGLDERISFRTLQSIAFGDLKPGEASQFLPTAEGGFIVYLKEKIPVSEAQVKAELPDFLARLRAYRQNEAFNNWFRKEADQAKLTLPKSQTEPSGARR
jgi:hypothetical protein